MFFLIAMQKQMLRLKTRVGREKLMIGARTDIAAQLVDLTREQGRLTMADAVSRTGSQSQRIKNSISANV